MAGANILVRVLPRLALLCFVTALMYPPLPTLGLIVSMILMAIAPLGAGVWRQPVMLLWSWATAISVGACLWLGHAKIAPGAATQFAVGALVLWLIASAFALIRSGRAGSG
jgi:hypothetical protein